MDGKMIAGGLVGILIIGGGGFYAGTKYQASRSPANRFAGAGGTAALAGRAGSTTRGVAGNAVFGSIIARDSNGITVQLGGPNTTSTNGSASGTRIVLVNESTQIGKLTTGSFADLVVGQMVTVSGSANSDGSLTASSVQIRPINTQR